MPIMGVFNYLFWGSIPYNILCVRNLNFVLLRLIQVLCNLIFVIVTVLFHNLSSSLRYYNYHEQCHFMLSVAS